jgi:hypothetical protein
MPSLMDRLGGFARSSQGKSLMQKATERFTGGAGGSGRGSGRGKSAARKTGRGGKRKGR